MADIFISYAKEDRSRAAALVKALAVYGWSIWWDRTIPAGKTWREVIGEALENAGSVIVIWSKTSVKSRWVQEEADWGLERKILIPILIDQARPPLGFGAVQALDFINWDPAKSSPEFEKLISDLSTILGPCPKHVKETEQAAEEERQRKQEEEQRKAEERGRFEEEHKRAEAERKAEVDRKREEVEEKRKVEEEHKRREAEAEAERAIKVQIERKVAAENKFEQPTPHQAVTAKVKLPEPKPDATATAQPKPPEPRRANNILKFSAVLVVILLMVGGIWWFSSESEKEKMRISELEKEKFRVETERKIAEIIEVIKNQEQNLAKIESAEQLDAFDKQNTELDKEIADIEHGASIAGISQQAQKARKLLDEFSILLSQQREKMEEAEKIAKAKPLIIETKTGKLFVVGVPDNANIRILNVDKRFQQGIELEPGKYHVQVSLQDYETQDRWIELNANEEKRMNFELKKEVPKVARLHVEAIPENAQVRILNIKPKFSPGMELEAGSYQLEVSAEGYETQIRWIELKPGHEKPFKFELTKKSQEPTKSRTEVPAPVVEAEPAVAAKESKPSPAKKITNSIGMEFILIPAGSFIMGSNIGYKDAKPSHEVEISQSFYLQTTEVTQGQWKKVMGDNPSKFKQCGDDCPVERVSWEYAQGFIAKLNQLEKTKAYRLPSEAEWEYACRAGTTTEYSFGDDASKLGEYGWYRDNSNKRTQKVATKKPNSWGLYDMHGNVWDWVEDDWHGSYEGAPADGRAFVDNSSGSYHVVRGGGWYSVAEGCRSATRINISPDLRRGDVGFRVFRSVALVP